MLRGPRVVLAPFVAADCDRLFAWIGDRDTVILSSAYHPVGEAAHRAWFEGVQQRPDVSVFAIRLADTGELIGSCQLNAIHPVYRSAELQIRIGPPEHRRQGFGTEALELLLAHAFDDLNLHRVHLHALASNASAIAAYEKLGFVEEGSLRRAAYVDGAYVDIVVMGLLADERPRPA